MTETREARIKEAIERLKKFQDLSHCRLSFPGKGMAIHTALSEPLRTLIEAIEAMEPRPIDEAPKQGGLLLFCDGVEDCIVAEYTPQEGSPDHVWATLDGPAYHKDWPSHFIALSALPQPEVNNDDTRK